MSLAWSTLAIVVLLLPGILFFVGLFLPEKFSRDVAPRNTLAELGAAVLIAFTIHGVAFVALTSTCNKTLPLPDLATLFALLQLPQDNPEALDRIEANLLLNAPWVVFYVLVTAVASTLLGWATGSAIVHDRLWLRRLAKHSWVYDLVSDDHGNLPFAYVLTNVQHQNLVLMYRGSLKAFGLAPDGRFSYLVLIRCHRYFMDLTAPVPRTTPIENWLAIGGTSAPPVGLGDPAVSSMLLIEGEDIANVVFERVQIRDVREAASELEEEIHSIQRLSPTIAAVMGSRRDKAPVETRAGRTEGTTSNDAPLTT